MVPKLKTKRMVSPMVPKLKTKRMASPMVPELSPMVQMLKIRRIIFQMKLKLKMKMKTKLKMKKKTPMKVQVSREKRMAITHPMVPMLKEKRMATPMKDRE